MRAPFTILRLGDQWPVIEGRMLAARARIPLDGMPDEEFVRSFLYDVPPNYIFETLRLLHGRGLLWVRRHGGLTKVFAARPAPMAEAKALRASPVGRMLSAMAPLMAALLPAAQASRAQLEAGVWDDFSEAAEEARNHCEMAYRELGRHESNTLTLEAMSRHLWPVFPEAAMKALAFHYPRLRVSPDGESATRRPAAERRRPRLPNNLTIEEQAFRRIERAGEAGIGRVALSRSFTPKLTGREIDDVLGQLEGAALIVMADVKARPDRKAGRRCFAAKFGAPATRSESGVTMQPDTPTGDEPEHAAFVRTGGARFCPPETTHHIQALV